MAAGTYSNVNLRYSGPNEGGNTIMGGGITMKGDSTADCALRVEAMLSTAILQQEDIICNLLLLVSPEPDATESCKAEESFFNCGTMPPTTVEVSPKFLIAMKSKLEMAMNWSQLAQLRLQGVLNNPRPHAIDPFSLSPSPSLTAFYNGSAQEMKHHYL